MTGLIAGAVLLIVASATTLVFGWIGSNEPLIWSSIGGSVGAAVCLALAYSRSKQETSRPPRRARPAGGEPTTPPVEEGAGAPATAAVSQDTQAIGAIDTDGMVVADGSRFHRPGCPQARGAGDRVDRDEAKRRGLEPCRVCRP